MNATQTDFFRSIDYKELIVNIFKCNLPLL